MLEFQRPIYLNDYQITSLVFHRIKLITPIKSCYVIKTRVLSKSKLTVPKINNAYTQKEAAALVHVSLRAWQLWEAGQRKMPTASWELCVIKCGLHPLYRVA